MDQTTLDALPSAERSSHAALRLLVDCAPDWATVDREAQYDVFLTAQPVQGSGKKARQYRLKLSLDRNGDVEVRERNTDLLPTFCPERHINEDMSFCLGYEAGRHVIDAHRANEWWDKLRLFLLCQDTAENTGYWPVYASLSHGDAGKFQMAGEAAAEHLGMIDDFKSAMQGSGWISDTVWQVTKDGKHLLNGRMRCLCGRIGRRGRPKLRRECRKDKDPCLVILEAQRRDAEEAFWKTKKGRTCCGTMKNCSLDPKWTAPPDRRARRRAKIRKRESKE